jgi:farnesyl-diphosphate farnesyltransferase
MKNNHSVNQSETFPNLEMWIKANEESLIKQSRSFSIPILNLDDRFLIPIMVEYNLNKTVDTIEDSPGLETDEKIHLIQDFCNCLKQEDLSSKVKRRMLEVAPKDEAYVFKNYEATINLYKTLSKQEKALARKWTTEMAEGMCSFLTRSIDTLKDLNDYCYYVAGTVGMYLTSILKLKGSNVTQNIFQKMEHNAVSFGLFLQKLNIIRDHVEDNTDKKRGFWPRCYFEQETDRVKILNKMCQETLSNDVPGAIEYYRHIPRGNNSYEYFIRFILSSGLEYLKILKNNKSVFSTVKVKLPRKFIKNLYAGISSQPPEEFMDYCERFHADEMQQAGNTSPPNFS